MRIPGPRRRARAALAIGGVAGAAACAWAVACGSTAAPTDPPSPLPSFEPALPTLAAAGDIACAPRSTGSLCRQADTASVVLDRIHPDLVLPLGDNQYESGSIEEYQAVYALSWGRLKAISRPVAGNHEYQTPRATGYFDYFNGRGAASGPAGERDKGYYSYDFAGWHFVALNSNCAAVGGCGLNTPQERWLRADLEAHRAPCTLAYAHHPRFSSGINGSSPELAALWQTLYDFGADVYLSGHEHHYERFAPQRADGVLDPVRGIQAFVVGTGGRDITPFVTVLPNSEVQDTSSQGVLGMKLGPTGYEWQFFALAGQPLADRGSAPCH